MDSAPAPGIEGRLRQLVERAGSQRAFARLMDLSPTTVTGWLRGSVPYQSTLRDICARTGVTWEWLVEGKGEADMQRVAEEAAEYGARESGTPSRKRRIAELAALLPTAGQGAKEEILNRLQQLIYEELRK